MRVVFISDTHLRHDFFIPEGDILVHSGDITMGGTMPELARAANWLNEVRVGHGFKAVVLAPGNHDHGFEKDPGLARSLFHPVINILIHQPIEIFGLKVFGSPYTPRFFDWAFNVDRGPELARLWAQIPDDTQILVTHGPPMGRLDTVKESDESDYHTMYGADFRYKIKHVGCADLRDRITHLPKLMVHAFGHIHRDGIEVGADKVTYINASICNEQYLAVHKPKVLDIEGTTVTVVS